MLWRYQLCTLCNLGVSWHRVAAVGKTLVPTARAPAIHPAGPYQSIRERKMALDGVSGVWSITEKLDWVRFSQLSQKLRKTAWTSSFKPEWRRDNKEVNRKLVSVKMALLKKPKRTGWLWKQQEGRPDSQLRHLVPSLHACRHAKLIPDNKAARIEELQSIYCTVKPRCQNLWRNWRSS